MESMCGQVPVWGLGNVLGQLHGRENVVAGRQEERVWQERAVQERERYHYGHPV